VGNQKNLPDHLKQKILDSPAKLKNGAFKKETRYHSEVRENKKREKRQEEVDKAFSSNYQKDPAVKRNQRLKEIELMRKNLKKSGKKSPNKILGGLIAGGVGKLAAKALGNKKIRRGIGKVGGTMLQAFGGPLGGMAGKAMGGLLMKRDPKKMKKTKAEKDHNKAARKTEGTRLRQAIRRGLAVGAGKKKSKKS
jgi:hypothetical protein